MTWRDVKLAQREMRNEAALRLAFAEEQRKERLRVAVVLVGAALVMALAVWL
jgi:hypothetical protein